MQFEGDAIVIQNRPPLINGIIGGWATTTNMRDGPDFAAYDNTGAIRPLGGAALPGQIEGVIGTSNVRIPTPGPLVPLSANQQINSLLIDTHSPIPTEINLGGHVLNISSGGLMINEREAIISNGQLTGGAAVAPELFLTGPGTLTVDADIVDPPQGNLALTVSGLGVNLNGKSSHSGPTVVNQGTIRLGRPDALPSTTQLILNGGSLRAEFARATPVQLGQVVVRGGGLNAGTVIADSYLVESGSVHGLGGDGPLRKIGDGVLTLWDGAGYSGNITLEGGVTRLGDSAEGGEVGDGASGLGKGVVTVKHGATLLNSLLRTQPQAKLILDGGKLVLGNNTVDLGGSIDVISQSYLSAIGATDNNPQISSAIAGSGDLIYEGPGRLTLDGDNSGYSGKISVVEGELKLASNTALGTGTVTVGRHGRLRSAVPLVNRPITLDEGELVVGQASFDQPVHVALNGAVVSEAPSSTGTASSAKGAAPAAASAVASAAGSPIQFAGGITLSPQAEFAVRTNDAWTSSVTGGPDSRLTVETGATLRVGQLDVHALDVFGMLTLSSAAKAGVIETLKVGHAGKVDITEGGLVLHDTSLSQTRQWLLSGRGLEGGGVANASWGGESGLMSSAASASYIQERLERLSIGYARNAELLSSYTTFLGQPVTDSDILLRLTKNGDANLDGIVNNNDITILAGFYRPGVTGKHWYQADFNYDGEVNNNDITILAGFYAPSATPFGGNGVGNGIAAVPEPSMGPLGILASTIMCRRRCSGSRAS